MKIISMSLLFLVCLSLCYTFYAFFCTWIFFRKNKDMEEKADEELPPVSIIKPVSEIGEETLENLMSFCDQDYPEYEVIFSLPREEESMATFLEEYKRTSARGKIRWIVVKQKKGPNYKVGALLDAVREAKYEMLAFSDADMQVGRDYLRQIVFLLLRAKASLVTCLYRGTDIRNIFSGFQSLTVQTDFIPNVLVDHRLEGISYAFGATILTRKEVLASFGGLETLHQYLADDYQLENRVYKKGYGISLSSYLVNHISSTRNFKEYFLHHLRWAVTQRICRPKGYFASIITRGVFLAFLFMVLQGFSGAAVALFLFVCGLRLFSVTLLNRAFIGNGEVSRYLWLTPVNDLLNSLFWFLSLFMNTVHWKDRRFQILRGGRIKELEGEVQKCEN